jgi:segregation and condensation protein A
VRVTVTDAVAELLHELPRIGRVTFAELTADLVERLEVVVQFLAVLELYKQGWIDLQQVDSPGALTVVWTGRPDDDGLDLDDLAFVDAYDG